MTTETQNSRFRYRIFTMVVLLALINYIDRGAMPMPPPTSPASTGWTGATGARCWAISATATWWARCSAACWPTATARARSGSWPA